jgi:hypothetical protein
MKIPRDDPRPESRRLKTYLVLEREALDLEHIGEDDIAEFVRECMDDIWLTLCPQDREFLRGRGDLASGNHH